MPDNGQFDDMRIILIKKIRDFYDQPVYEHVRVSLQQWCYILGFRTYRSFSQILEDFNDTEKTDGLYVFNIEGGKYKIATSICFDTECIYVRFVGTSPDYDSFMEERNKTILYEDQ